MRKANSNGLCIFMKLFRNTLLISAVVILSPCTSCADSKVEIERKAAEEKQERIREAVKARETSIYFFGKVVDQGNNSIEGALVEVHVRHFIITPPFFMGTRRFTVSTDKNGVFEINDISGSDLFVNEISKDGYAFSRSANERTSFRYKGIEGEDHFVPDKKDPVFFEIRKKEDPTFLFKGQGGPMLKPPKATVAFDFIQERTRLADESPDLLVTAIYHEDAQEYEIVFVPQGYGAGVIVSEEVLYQSPEEGYNSQYVTRIKRGAHIPQKNLFVRSRDVSIFTRMDLELLPGKKFLRLAYEFWTNPYGDRILEPETEIPFAIMKRLKGEAKVALKQGKRPKKHDLKALIKAEKETKK